MFLSSGVVQFVVLVPNNVGNVAPSCQYGYQVQAGFKLLGTYLGTFWVLFWVLFGYLFEYVGRYLSGYLYIVGRVLRGLIFFFSFSSFSLLQVHVLDAQVEYLQILSESLRTLKMLLFKIILLEHIFIYYLG